MMPRHAFLIGPICLAGACSAPSASNQAAQARPAEPCAHVRRDHAQDRAAVLRRVRELQADEQRASRAGKSELERQGKFMELANAAQAAENRYAIRLRECSES